MAQKKTFTHNMLSELKTIFSFMKIVVPSKRFFDGGTTTTDIILIFNMSKSDRVAVLENFYSFIYKN